jgi:pimeloyl-ACP methyl ester carboxylesterase
VLTNCDCFEVFPPKEFVPMVKSARVPGAVKAALQPMRSAAARRTMLAYGGLAREIPDEVTAAWTEPARTDSAIRDDLIRFMKAVDKSVAVEAATRLPQLKVPSLVAWAQDDRFFPRELGERLAATLPNARLEPVADSRTFVPEDQPEALAELIRGFVRETAAQAA